MEATSPNKESLTNIENIELEGSVMCTFPVMEKSTGNYGIMVASPSIKEVNVETIAHEAVHVADYMCNQMNLYTQDFIDGNEAYAYLVGWSAGKISEAITNFKRNKYD